MTIAVYSNGLCFCSACAPNTLDAEAVAAWVNAENPTGLDQAWVVSPEPFKTGEPNPCPCRDPGRRHWLLEC